MSGHDEGFLARWSRRKIESRAARPDASPQPEVPDAAVPRAMPPQDAAPPAPAVPAQSPARELPPLESLTPESDFAPFMRADVDPAVKGEALKTLFSDPALYPMDGLDVYIDDYTKPDPLPPGWLERLNQLASLHGDPAVGTEPPNELPAANGEASPAEPGTARADESSNPPAPAQEDGAAGDAGA